MQEIKLAIAGSFGNLDIGDEAMLTEDLDFILNSLKIPRENIYLIGAKPDYISFYHNHPIDHCLQDAGFLDSGLKHLAKSAFKAVLNGKHAGIETTKAALDCDALLVTGGGTINTRNLNGSSLRRMHAIVTSFCRIGKPVFMSGQTIGPLGVSEQHDRLAREIIQSVDFLSVRDNYYSKRYIEAIHAKAKLFVETVDDACALPYKAEKLPPEINEFIKSGETVAVNITDYTVDSAGKRAFIACLCEHLISHYSFNILLVSHAPNDYTNLNTILENIGRKYKKNILLPDTMQWRDSMLKKLISSCRLAIGGRYHFIVFAGTSNTPFIGMNGNHYSYIKQHGFAMPLGLDALVLTEKETWKLSIIKSRIKHALEQKLDVERKFKRPSVSMRYFGKWLQELAVQKPS